MGNSDGGGGGGGCVMWAFAAMIVIFGVITMIGGSVKPTPNNNTTTTTTSTTNETRVLSDWEALSRNQVNLFSRVNNFFDEATSDGLLSDNEMNFPYTDSSTTSNTANNTVSDVNGSVIMAPVATPWPRQSYLNPETGQTWCTDAMGNYSAAACLTPVAAPSAP